ncbi:hypothetical protein Tco_1026225 [Tanacetum coccineum]
MERHAYCERFSKLQGKEIRTPRVANWILFYSYNFDETLKNKIKFEYIHSDGDVFEDYSWERALSISRDVYPEWCLEFFSTMLSGHKQVLTLPQFAVLLGLYEEYKLKHHLFAIHFTKLEVDDRLFNHDAYWQQIGTLTRTNLRTSLIKEPLMRIVHRLLVGSFVYRAAKHLCKHTSVLKENSLICGGHYVTGNGYSLKDKNEAKTEHGNGKSVKSQNQSQKVKVKDRSRRCVYLKWANPHPFNGSGQPIKPISINLI